MIVVSPSPTADTRTCDVTKVKKETLRDSSFHHIQDVQQGLGFFSRMLIDAGIIHDYDKISELEWFFDDFKTKFEKTGWWDNHRKIHRHHLNHADGVPEDVNLVDVIEYIVDCVMAVARSGEVYDVELSSEVLQRAMKNTVELLKSNVRVDK